MILVAITRYDLRLLHAFLIVRWKRREMLQFSATRFARINLLTSVVRSWERRIFIQNSVRNERNPFFLSLSFFASVAFLPSFFVWVSRGDLCSSSTSTERKRESNLDHWIRCTRPRISPTWNRYDWTMRESIWRVKHPCEERIGNRPTELIRILERLNPVATGSRMRRILTRLLLPTRMVRRVNHLRVVIYC